MVTNIYNCTQQQAYNTCRFAWRACQQNLLSFANYKSNYNVAFVAENLDAIDAADALDDHKARYSATKQLYVALTKEKDNVTDLFAYLKGYITTAYADDVRDIVIEEAGQQFSASANTGKWASVTGLLSAMLPFVFKNETILIQKGFAPANFLARVQETKQRFDAAYKTYKEEEDAASYATDEKIVATNDVCAKTLEMLADAKIVFRRDDVSAKKFVWGNILAQTRGTKNAGIMGFVTEGSAKKGIKDADVTCIELNKTVKTDNQGRFDLSPLAVGKYTFRVEADGFAPFMSDERKIASGVTGRMNVEMSVVASRLLLRERAAKE